MNVAVLKAKTGPAQARPVLDPPPETVGRASDWIDPEGNDWLAAIYRELTSGLEPGASIPGSTPDPEHWFG
jgi:hypothetical protein